MSTINNSEKGAFIWNIRKIINKGDYKYALVPEHPNATKNGYVLLHRVVIENHLGRLLNNDEVVHHKNHNKFDNRIENLEVMNRTEHIKMYAHEHGRKYVILKCPVCNKIFHLPKNQSFLQKPNQLNCTCCSRTCNAKLHRYIQLHGLTDKVKAAISENLQSEYIKYIAEDNSEET